MTSLITQASTLWLMPHTGFQQFGNQTTLNAQLRESNKKSDGMNLRYLSQLLPVLHYGTSTAAWVGNMICTLCNVHTHTIKSSNTNIPTKNTQVTFGSCLLCTV